MNTKYDQFAIDIGVSKREILEKKSIFKSGQPNNAMRYHARNDGVFILSDNRFLCRVNNKSLCDELKLNYEFSDTAWFGEKKSLEHFEGILKKYDYTLNDSVPYYSTDTFENLHDPHLKIIRQDTIKSFIDNQDFKECFIFDTQDPDILGVAYIENNRMVGLAGCNQQGAFTYEIALKILKDFEGKNIATKLIKKLVYEMHVLRPDLFCLYSTQFTHLASLRVAEKAGLRLEWVEFTIEKEKTSR